MKRVFWWTFDPILRKIGSRMAHLGVLTPPVDRRYLDTIASLDPTAKIEREATIVSNAPRENLAIGAFTYVCGELLALTSSARLQVGHHCTIGPGSRIWAQDCIEIGDHVMISHNVDIHDSDSHPLDASLRREHTMQFCEHGLPFDMTHVATRPVRIADDVWIGFKASILKGVTIGRGAVVAAASVVSNDVPANAVVAGNPAKVVKMLDDEERRLSFRQAWRNE